MRFDFQNLNERTRRSDGTAIKHGRWWLYFGQNNSSLNCEWQWFSGNCGAEISLASHDHAVMVSFCCLLFSVYLSLNHYPLERRLEALTKRKGEKYGNGRSIGIRIFDGAIWFDLWNDPMEWRSADPKWWHFNIRPADLLLGRHRYSERDLSTERTEIPMPEGCYPATIRFFESRWKRSRWPFAKKLVRADITPDTPIPFPGKGENSWDCGEDATHALTTVADTALKATMAMTESVMRSRLKYGGKNWRPKAFDVA